MLSIKPILSDKFLSKVNNKLFDSKFFNKQYIQATENSAKFAAKTALISALTKDAVGCYYYVTQSLHNERIPDDKRNFVASLDLMNGILNVGLQFTIGMLIDKKAPQLFDKTIGKALNKINTRKIAQKITPLVSQNPHMKNKDPKLLEEQIQHFLRYELLGTAEKAGKTSKWLKVGYSAAVMLIGTQIVTKRIIVPFLSTPLAGWFKEKYLDKKPKPTVHDRVYYQWANTAKQENMNKTEKSAFSNMHLK